MILSSKWSFSWLLILLVLVSRPLLAEERNDKTLSPYFFVQEGDSSVDSFPLKETAVDAVINGVIAEVCVVQKYVNHGSQPINGRYVFPASTRNGKWRVLWLGITLGISYLLTLGVNGLRIAAAVSLYQQDIYGGWLTPERAHRIEGTLIYFSFLLIANLCVNRIVHQFLSRGPVKGFVWSLLTPFLWYCLISLGIPLLNKAPLRGGLRFIEHGALVLSVCAGVLLFSAVLFLLWEMAAVRIRGRRRGDSYYQGW